MAQKLRLYVEATEAQETFIDLPDDWHDMDEDERADFCADAEQDFLLEALKCGSEIIER